MTISYSKPKQNVEKVSKWILPMFFGSLDSAYFRCQSFASTGFCGTTLTASHWGCKLCLMQ